MQYAVRSGTWPTSRHTPCPLQGQSAPARHERRRLRDRGPNVSNESFRIRKGCRGRLVLGCLEHGSCPPMGRWTDRGKTRGTKAGRQILAVVLSLRREALGMNLIIVSTRWCRRSSHDDGWGDTSDCWPPSIKNENCKKPSRETGAGAKIGMALSSGRQQSNPAIRRARRAGNEDLTVPRDISHAFRRDEAI